MLSACKVNDNSIKVLEKLALSLAQIHKKFVLISQKEFKKIAITKFSIGIAMAILIKIL
jgi:hypothetical protein